MARVTIGIDPGGTTGIAIFSDVELVECEAVMGGFDGFMEWWRSKRGADWAMIADALVVEDFIVEPDFVGRAYPSEIIGAIRALWSGELIVQPRSAKSTLFNQVFTGDKGEMERAAWLKERGLTFFTPHEMDAATHVLVERKRARDMEFWRRYWA